MSNRSNISNSNILPDVIGKIVCLFGDKDKTDYIKKIILKYKDYADNIFIYTWKNVYKDLEAGNVTVFNFNDTYTSIDDLDFESGEPIHFSQKNYNENDLYETLDLFTNDEYCKERINIVICDDIIFDYNHPSIYNLIEFSKNKDGVSFIFTEFYKIPQFKVDKIIKNFLCINKENELSKN